jgi:hypothetical protein
VTYRFPDDFRGSLRWQYWPFPGRSVCVMGWSGRPCNATTLEPIRGAPCSELNRLRGSRSDGYTRPQQTRNRNWLPMPTWFRQLRATTSECRCGSLWGAAMFFFLLAGGSVLRSLNAYDEWDLERIKWGERPTSWPQRWRKKIGRTRFGPPGLASRKIPEIARKATPQTQASIHSESSKVSIQPVLPFFGSTTAADDDRPKEWVASKETKRIE